MISRFAKLGYFNFVLLILANQSFALPPLGLTPIVPGFGSKIEIIDGTAYISKRNGVQTVLSTGELDFIPIMHPTLGIPDGVPRVVKAFDGELYVAANFPAPLFGTALFRLDQPMSPLVTWEDGGISGVASDLRSYGSIENATVFYVDGSTETLPFPAGSDSSNNITYVISTTPSGYSIGDAGIPGTIGSAPGIWDPTGEFSFLDGAYSSSSIRDREDGNGVNAGWDNPAVKYGSDSFIPIKNNNGQTPGNTWVLVSQGDFVIVSGSFFGHDDYGYYPGIDPAHPDRAVLLLDIFPELATIDIDFISDLASADGFVYMTLQGDDGAFLFGARDPSVVPEPSSIALAVASIVVLAMRRRMGHFWANCWQVSA